MCDDREIDELYNTPGRLTEQFRSQKREFSLTGDLPPLAQRRLRLLYYGTRRSTGPQGQDRASVNSYCIVFNDL